MSLIPGVPYIDIHVPLAASEQEFLRLAVQAAARRFRELQTQSLSSFRPSGAEILASPSQVGGTSDPSALLNNLFPKFPLRAQAR